MCKKSEVIIRLILQKFEMPNFYQNPNVLDVEGYEIYFTRFSDSIIKDHFNVAVSELTEVLKNFTIKGSEVIKGGGGLSSITQNLARLLNMKDWSKKIVQSEHRVEGKTLSSESHEVDHYKSFDQGNIGLEIEWNNKDPFYDRDLENFRKLHQIGELSLGIIITRGASLQHELYNIYYNFLNSLYPYNMTTLLTHFQFSDKAKSLVKEYMDLTREECVTRTSRLAYSSKYGQATTHMNKLLLRLNRGVGNPCPFILIGIGKERLYHETVHPR